MVLPQSVVVISRGHSRHIKLLLRAEWRARRLNILEQFGVRGKLLLACSTHHALYIVRSSASGARHMDIQRGVATFSCSRGQILLLFSPWLSVVSLIGRAQALNQVFVRLLLMLVLLGLVV